MQERTPQSSTRRTMLAGFGAAAAVPIFPAAASASDTPNQRAYRAWRRERDAATRIVAEAQGPWSDEFYWATFAKADALEAAILKMPVRTAYDLACVLQIETLGGTEDFPISSVALTLAERLAPYHG